MKAGKGRMKSASTFQFSNSARCISLIAVIICGWIISPGVPLSCGKVLCGEQRRVSAKVT